MAAHSEVSANSPTASAPVTRNVAVHSVPIRADEPAPPTADGTLSERHTVAALLRSAADGIARKTYALEQLADRMRGPSQATIYKALQALEKERAIFADLSERIDTVRETDWASFEQEAWRALDAVREPDEEPAQSPHGPPTAPKKRPTGSAAAAAKK